MKWSLSHRPKHIPRPCLFLESSRVRVAPLLGLSKSWKEAYSTSRSTFRSPSFGNFRIMSWATTCTLRRNQAAPSCSVSCTAVVGDHSDPETAMGTRTHFQMLLLLGALLFAVAQVSMLTTDEGRRSQHRACHHRCMIPELAAVALQDSIPQESVAQTVSRRMHRL